MKIEPLKTTQARREDLKSRIRGPLSQVLEGDLYTMRLVLEDFQNLMDRLDSISGMLQNARDGIGGAIGYMSNASLLSTGNLHRCRFPNGDPCSRDPGHVGKHQTPA